MGLSQRLDELARLGSPTCGKGPSACQGGRVGARANLGLACTLSVYFWRLSFYFLFFFIPSFSPVQLG